jgi:hypothetical protein
MREANRLLPIARLADDGDPPVAAEDRLEGLGEEAVIISDQHADT